MCFNCRTMQHGKFTIDWIPCNRETKLPVLRTRNFLKRDDWYHFNEQFPHSTILRESLVYDTKTKHEVKSEYVRNSRGCREKSPQVIRDINRSIVSVLNDTLKMIPNFCQLIFREDETEWLLYNEHDFFRVHQDFERYVCDDMAPYVLVYGLQNTKSGGETILHYNDHKFVCKESCMENSAVFFPAHIPHESRSVYDGEKRCLKLEFYVFFYSNAAIIKCVDIDGKNDSIWRKSFLDSIDCFLSSLKHFDSMNKKYDKGVLKTDMASSLRKLSISLHDRQLTKESEDNYDFLFPDIEFTFLQDLYNLLSFIDSKHSFFVSENPSTWEWYNRSPKSNCIPLVLVWTKNSKNQSYFLEDIYMKHGSKCYKSYCKFEDFNKDEYIDFSSFKTMLCRDKIVEKEGRTRRSLYTVDYTKKMKSNKLPAVPDITVNKEIWEKIHENISKIQPNDNVHPPRFHSASFQRQISEMCNCEDLGFETYVEDVYITLYIQIRWVLINIESIF